MFWLLNCRDGEPWGPWLRLLNALIFWFFNCKAEVTWSLGLLSLAAVYLLFDGREEVTRAFWAFRFRLMPEMSIIFLPFNGFAVMSLNLVAVLGALQTWKRGTNFLLDSNNPHPIQPEIRSVTWELLWEMSEFFDIKPSPHLAQVYGLFLLNFHTVCTNTTGW